MFHITSEFLKFNNIQEIIFTKVEDDIFSIKIKSDIEMNEQKLEDNTFEARLCKLEPTLSLVLGSEQVNYNIGGIITKSQTFTIPLNIQLLLNGESKEFFTVVQNQDENK